VNPIRFAIRTMSPGGRNRFHWFNTSCFVAAPYGTYGNSTFGAVTTPGINNWNLTVEKSTPTNFPKDIGRVDFRLDMLMPSTIRSGEHPTPICLTTLWARYSRPGRPGSCSSR